MYEPNKHQQAGQATRPSTTIRRGGPLTGWGRSHVKGVALIRLLVALWLVILGVVFCASGHWWGALYFPGAALVAWLAYQLPRSKRTRAAGQNVSQPR